MNITAGWHSDRDMISNIKTLKCSTEAGGQAEEMKEATRHTEVDMRRIW